MSHGTEGGDVLSSLPRSRPQRRSAKRDATASKRASKPAAKKPRKAPAKPRARTAAKPKVGGAPRPSAATRRAREDRVTPPPTAEPPERDLVTTAVEAAGEIARIGITVGTQLVREATRRLPKP
jgi:hypothetical protein